MSLAEHLEKAERLAESKRWEQAAAALEPAGESTEVLKKRCFYLSRAGHYEQAIALLEELAGRMPTSARIPYMLGYQYAQREQHAIAVTHYEQAVSLDPNYLKAHYRLAQAYSQLDRKLRAQVSATRVLRLWRESDDQLRMQNARMYSRACYLLAKLQLRQEPEGSVTLLREAIEYEPDDHNKHYLLGKALTRAGDPEAALAPLRRAKAIDPRKRYIDIEIVRALLDSGHDDEAGAILRKFASRCSGWDAYNAARLARRLGELQIARELLVNADRRGPARGNPLVKDELRALPASSPSKPTERDTETARRSASDMAMGKVVYLNPHRHFGFLVDQGGVKRHFRIKDTSPPKGSRVTFVPAEQKKGPAAHDVRIAS